MTQHALDRMTERGIPRYEVIDVLEAPELTYGNPDLPEVRVAIGALWGMCRRPDTGDVITVALRTDQDKEHDVSGWINLDAKSAEKLLASWGFTIHSEKGQVNLWTHPDDEEKATGTPWPTGGVLIQDEDGVYYVARKLVEEGR